MAMTACLKNKEEEYVRVGMKKELENILIREELPWVLGMPSCSKWTELSLGFRAMKLLLPWPP